MHSSHPCDAYSNAFGLPMKAPYGLFPYNRRKFLLIVYAILLWKPFCYQPCFIPFNGTITIPLDLVDPFISKKFSFYGKITQLPCVMLDNGIYFLIHSLHPHFVRTSLFKTRRLKIIKISNFRRFRNMCIGSSRNKIIIYHIIFGLTIVFISQHLQFLSLYNVVSSFLCWLLANLLEKFWSNTWEDGLSFNNVLPFID